MAEKNNTWQNIVRIFKGAYTPDGFKKTHLVALAYGIVIGGFVAGTVVGGATGGRMWILTAICVGCGSLVGAIIALNLVNNPPQKS